MGQFKKILKFIFHIIFKILYNSFSLLPIKKNQVLFASDRRENLSDNFSFIFSEIKKQQLPIDCKFAFNLKQNSMKQIVQLAYLLARSKVILVDDYYPYIYPLKIRQNSEIIQVWHAVGAFKRFGFSLTGVHGAPKLDPFMHRNYSKAIVSSKNVASHYAEAFNMSENQIVATGIPRTDVFFDEEYKSKKIVGLYDRFPFLKDKKVIMYAPTFRGKGKNTAYYPLAKVDFAKWHNALKEDYVFLIKWHPYIKEKVVIPEEFASFYYDVSDYSDINDLLFVTDILITDYSSVCFEYALLRKPIIFYAFDVEDYTHNRDFYYPYESFIPGPLVKESQELLETIQEEKFDMSLIDDFVNYFFDHQDGKSSERFVNQLLK
ncbi:CDP-glycerol:glycerophosphate glycerophosphotransferase [Alkalihalobacillus alcalophilus ATCC 27647 = CGMCC 1.3604]|nr:CDP-glycerol--glycerophosphate glycerophosphotransferase [Alkalihalobacillus alcalophilus]KGA96894.1 CDP-glycerol:glycerophosphate glycerophosphotransferase [Alkalihalobacillus alcalophilus ATCC 27647 = CGMCC 1.3604]MED1562639.1 CDP-glycerol--glycerophosphate glycerophosphotransferase [Alkalihalobacillus alcalophilus]